MPRQTAATATNAKPLSLSEAKGTLSRLVGEGKVRAAGAKLIDIRELTTREREVGEALAQTRARHSKAA